MRIKNIIILCALTLPLGALSQNVTDNQTMKSHASADQLTFKEYCLQESIYYITISKEKADAVSFTGELNSLENNKDATHIDYGVEPKEEETQYYHLIGSERVLVVKSIFVLRLAFNKSINK